MSVNRIIIVGNLGRDPELGEGTVPYCRFSVATTDFYKGEKTYRMV